MTAPIPTVEAPLSALDLFPTYASRAEYKSATGKDAPDFDPSKPLKTWFDPDAETHSNGLRADGTFFATVAAIYPGLRVKTVPSGYSPDEFTIELSRQDAATVNLLGENMPLPAQSLPEVAHPRRDLDPAEILGNSTNMMGGVVVINVTLRDASQKQSDIQAGKFTPDDRAMLQRIAAKLQA